ncbi:hypothetical protein [Fluviispira multicolorata]|uniref:Uncharacterized protein n=1 Tax=Fluviispira multicolorata TaxID=2654512 RepID=A0A833JCP6_9BACT|nr:hypothetical protein [Fluviispira multicolorata]KAB8027377.1 hypothetical protein GCL57_14360 [Fluviispira multicolorata]
MQKIIISSSLLFISYSSSASSFVSAFDSTYKSISETLTDSAFESNIITPTNCNSISEFFGKCKNLGTTDQASIAEKDWENFNIFKDRFENFKNKNEIFITKINEIPKNHVSKSIFKQFEHYYAKLHVINEIDSKFIWNNFKINSVNELFTDTVNQLAILLNHGENQFVESIISGYFKKFPTIFRSIEFNYWYKSYWPAYSEKWGGFGPNYYQKSTYSLANYGYLSQYIEKSNEDDYDFTQTEKEFYAKWNNWNTQPSSETKTKKVYYKFKYKEDPDIISKYLGIMNKKEVISIIKNEIKKRETIEIIKNKIVEFPSAIFKTLLAMELADESEHDKAKLKKNQFKLNSLFLDFLPKTTKVISKLSNKCLSYTKAINNDAKNLINVMPSKKKEYINANIKSCIPHDLSQEFIIFPIDSAAIEFMIASANEKGKCLSPFNSPHQFEFITCNIKDSDQKWIFEKQNNINIIKNSNLKYDFLENDLEEIYHIFKDKAEYDLSQDLQWITPTSGKNNFYLKSLALGNLAYSQSGWDNGFKIKKDLPNILYAYLFIQKYSLPTLPNAKKFINKIKTSRWFDTLQPEVKSFISSLPNKTSLPDISKINNLFTSLKLQKFSIGELNRDTDLKEIHFYSDQNNIHKLNLFVRNFTENPSSKGFSYPNEAKSNNYFTYLGNVDINQSKQNIINIFNILHKIKTLTLEYKFLSLVNPKVIIQLNSIVNQMKSAQYNLKEELNLQSSKINRGTKTNNNILGNLTSPIVKIINNPLPPPLPLLSVSSRDSGYSYLTEYEYMDMNPSVPIQNNPPSNIGSSIASNNTSIISPEGGGGYLRMDGGEGYIKDQYLIERLKDFDEFEDLDAMEYQEVLKDYGDGVHDTGEGMRDYGDGMNDYLYEFENAVNMGEDANEALNMLDSTPITTSSTTVAIGGASVATLLSVISIL